MGGKQSKSKNGPKSKNKKSKKSNKQLISEMSGQKKKVCLADFELMHTIGRGSFGKVIQVKKKDNGKIYAMKVMNKHTIIQKQQYEHTVAERRILQIVDNPFIVRLQYAFQTDTKLYLVLDFYNGGEIYYYLSKEKRFSEERVQFYAAEMVLALEYLHSKDIIYRDLKPENLILSKTGHIRLTDMGLSKEHEDKPVLSLCGTAEYLAPELLLRRPYDKAVDWWAFGTVIYEMMVGLPPFYHKNRQIMFRKIMHEPFLPSPHINRAAADFCRRLLMHNPMKRLGSNGIDEIKNHKFFDGIDWDKLAKLEVKPPFVPPVEDESDVSQIDPAFVELPVGITPTPRMNAIQNVDFKDFTFQPHSIQDAMHRVASSSSLNNNTPRMVGSDSESQSQNAMIGSMSMSMSVSSQNSPRLGMGGLLIGGERKMLAEIDRGRLDTNESSILISMPSAKNKKKKSKNNKKSFDDDSEVRPSSSTFDQLDLALVEDTGDSDDDDETMIFFDDDDDDDDNADGDDEDEDEDDA
eukprot:TRINITY_DN236004_c0_g1_i1.p1 TRINITY_DN236004_c0_g1~~TRINITY_DN236004_c0_g1_i1.p1  ORF type:complete len:521 (-),score=156.68 TRINITY_DN236004_c0_g1_i1:901-2463(-)